MNDVYPGNEGVAGSFSFSGQYTGNSAAGTAGGNGVADFLLGLPSDVTLGTPFNFHLRNTLLGAFVQDNWRLTSHLTVNLGLRYELTTPRGDSDHNNNVNFDKITGMPQIGKNYNTYTGIDNFQPRIGLAWQPAFLPNTVFRAAYGISTYMEGNGVNNLAVVNPPYVVNREANNTGLSLPPFTLDQGYTAFPSAPCTAAGLLAFSSECLSSTTVHATNPNIQPAVDQQWNVTVQHQFGNSTTVSAAYVGNKIDHMTDIYLLNQEQLVNGVISPSPFAAPLIAAGANVRYNDSSAIQRFNALELSLVERPFHGVQVLANYTWSKCLSNSLGYFGQYGDEEGVGVSQTGGGYFFFQNIYDQKADYGRCISNVMRPAPSTATCSTNCRSATESDLAAKPAAGSTRSSAAGKSPPPSTFIPDSPSIPRRPINPPPAAAWARRTGQTVCRVSRSTGAEPSRTSAETSGFNS